MKLKWYLRLTSIVLLVVVSLTLGTSVFLRVKNTTREYLDTENEIGINALKYNAETVFDELYSVCSIVKNSTRYAEMLDACIDESKDMYSRVVAYQIICRAQTMYESCYDAIRAVTTVTPQKVYYSESLRHYEYHAPAGSEIEFHYCPGEMSYLTFNLATKPDCFVNVILSDNFMNLLTYGSEDICILDGENVIYGSDKVLSRMNAVSSKLANGWEAVYAADQSKYRERYDIIFAYVAIGTLTTLVMGFVLSLTVASRVVRPLEMFGSELTEYQPRKKRTARKHQFARTDSLRSLIAWYLIISVFLPTLLFAGFEHMTEERLREEIADETNRHAVQVTSNVLSEFFSHQYRLSAQIAMDNNIVIPMRDGADRERVSKALHENLFYSMDKCDVLIYNKNNELVYSSYLLPDTRITLVDSAQLINTTDWQQSESITGEINYTHAMNIDPTRTPSCGIAVLSISQSEVEHIINRISADMPKLIISDKIPETYENSRIAGTDWYMCAVSNDAGSAVDFGSVSILCALVCLILIVSGMQERHILAGVNNVSKALTGYEPGITDEHKLSGIREIDVLWSKFDDMTQRTELLIDELLMKTDENLRLDNKRKDAEIAALQMQINPHFLSNTIDTIISAINAGDTECANKMLYALNSLFRLCLSRPEHVITAGEEISYARSYVSIVSIRFPQIRFCWEIDDSLIEKRTVKLILQPLIENAIIHGVKRSSGIITIRLYKNAEKLVFEVEDNGTGFEPELLEKLRSDLSGAQMGNEIGLMNVQARLRLHFSGENTGLQIVSGSTGSIVRIQHSIEEKE